jgi:hypothetical protein
MEERLSELGGITAGFFTSTLLCTWHSPFRTFFWKTILQQFHKHPTALLCIPKLKVNLEVHELESVEEIQ